MGHPGPSPSNKLCRDPRGLPAHQLWLRLRSRGGTENLFYPLPGARIPAKSAPSLELPVSPVVSVRACLPLLSSESLLLVNTPLCSTFPAQIAGMISACCLHPQLMGFVYSSVDHAGLMEVGCSWQWRVQCPKVHGVRQTGSPHCLCVIGAGSWHPQAGFQLQALKRYVFTVPF